MSINWVMLSGPDGFTPLAGEQKLYTSPPRTALSLQSLNKFPGKAPYHLQSPSGIVHLTNRRVRTIPTLKAKQDLTRNHQIIYLPTTPTDALTSFAAPILNLHDTHVDTPWFGPNTWTALVQPVSGGGIPAEHAALELKLTFKEGGAFDFSTNYERVKERLQQAVEAARESGHVLSEGRGAPAGVDMDAVHLDELPAYEEGGGGGVPVTARAEGSADIAGQRSGAESVAGTLSPAQQTFTPPGEPPPGYEEAQMDSVVEAVERRLRTS